MTENSFVRITNQIKEIYLVSVVFGTAIPTSFYIFVFIPVPLVFCVLLENFTLVMRLLCAPLTCMMLGACFQWQ